MFDLNNAINHWRTALSAQPNFQEADLTELEDHLHEEIATLMAGGLNEEEAFIISSRRLGNPEDLSGEFAIADPERRRRFRLSWMITGALAMVFLWVGAGILTNFGAGLFWRMGAGPMFDPNAMGFASEFFRMVMLLLGGLVLWRLLATDRSSRRLKKMNGKTVIAASLLIALIVLVASLGSKMFLAGGFTQIGFAGFHLARASVTLGVMFLLPLLLLVGLWRLVKS